MNCAAFERQIERYESGTMPDTERRRIDQHLCQCAACRALLEAIQSGENTGRQFDLSPGVLLRTTGSACTRCRSLLGNLVDGDLDRIESELVRAHLDSCASCGSLFRVMSQMGEVLPGMREMEPGPSFVDDVLDSVRALRRGRPRLSRVLEYFRSLTERPRFTWEAAYLGTLLVFGLFGTPFSPVPDAGPRLLASLQNREGLVAQAGSSIERCRQEALVAIGASARARETVARLTERSAQQANLLIRQGSEYVRDSQEYLASARKAAQARMARVFWQSRRSDAPPKR